MARLPRQHTVSGDTTKRPRRGARFLLLALPPAAIALTVQYIDKPVARAVWAITSADPALTERLNNLPNLLPAAVTAGTAILCSFVIARCSGRIISFARLAAPALPLAFLMKLLLQFAFGHTSVRLWLQEGVPVLFRPFHPYRSAGFPLGHSLVLAAFLTAVWLHFPRLRPTAALLMTGMAAALLATSYHFVSDILAGVWCGILITFCLDRWMGEGRRDQE